MSGNTDKHFRILFATIIVLEQLTGYYKDVFIGHYIAKPAIVFSLIFLVINKRNFLSNTALYLILTALSLSVLGDILLMFDEKSPHYFTLGLTAFLFAHITYSVIFLKERNKKITSIPEITALILYAISFSALIYDYLGEFLIPVLIYILIILIMVITSVLRHGNVVYKSYFFVLIGALLFLFSDSILAVDKFYSPFAYSNTAIMISYALAQYFIVFGLLKSNTVTTIV